MHDLDAEIDELEEEIIDMEEDELVEGLRYAVDEGFIEIREEPDGQFTFWPIDNAYYPDLDDLD